MPITSERMLFSLDIAGQAADKAETARRTFNAILNDADSLQARLNELKIEDKIFPHDDSGWFD
jgi:hypothetical protein